MVEAFLVLGGAFVGVLGTVLTDAARSRRENTQSEREALRTTAAEFLTQIGRARRLSHELWRDHDDQILPQISDALTEARAAYERLRLTARSLPAQEAARHMLHFTQWMSRSARGQRPGYGDALTEVEKWVGEFCGEIRKELGIKGYQDVYLDPTAGLPNPPGVIWDNPNENPRLGSREPL
jgi:hypothetical protein